MPKSLLKQGLEGYFLDQVDVACIPYSPYFETISYAPASELEVRRRKIACLDSILVKAREKHRETKQGFQERWETAAQRMKAVDEAIVKFDEHYRESNEDRDRSVRLAARQDELKDFKLADIRSLKKEKEFLINIREETASRVERFNHVQKYLEKVRDDSNGEYKTIRDLLDRYNLLSGTRAVLMDRDTRARDLVRRRTKQLNDLKLIKANEAVSLNNHIFEMREEFEDLKNHLMRLDEDFVHIKTTAAKRAKDLGQVRIATYNLYLQVCRKFQHPATISASDTIQQLHYIQNSMKEMSKLRKEVKHILKAAREAAERERKAEEHAAMEAYRKKFLHRNRIKATDVHAIFGIERPHGHGHGHGHPHHPKGEHHEKEKLDGSLHHHSNEKTGPTPNHSDHRHVNSPLKVPHH